MGAIDREDDSEITGAFAVASVPFLALKGLHVPTEGVVFHSAYAFGDLPLVLGRQVSERCLGVVGEPNDPVHA